MYQQYIHVMNLVVIFMINSFSKLHGSSFIHTTSVAVLYFLFWSYKSENKKKSYILFCNLQERMSGPQPNDEGKGSDEEDEDNHEETLCGSCGEYYNTDELWICCDPCQRWFHGSCVNITPAEAEHITRFKCQTCTNERARPWRPSSNASIIGLGCVQCWSFYIWNS